MGFRSSATPTESPWSSCKRGREPVRGRRDLHALRRAARRRARRRRAPSAVRGTTPASICAPGEAARAPALSDLPLLRGRRRARGTREWATSDRSPAGGSRARGASSIVVRRRRSRRRRRRRSAAARGLWRTDHADRRRAARPGRSPEPLEGLPGGHRAGGLDPAAPDAFYDELGVTLLIGTPATALDTTRRQVTLAERTDARLRRAIARDGRRAGPALGAGGGSAPRARAAQPGRRPRHHRGGSRYADARSSSDASFIGLEVAAALRQRGLEVDVIGREAVPLGRVLGRGAGPVRQERARGSTACDSTCRRARAAIRPGQVELDDGEVARRRPRRDGRGRAPPHRAGRSGGAARARWRGGRRADADERAGRVRRGRYRALPRGAPRRAGAHRALGRGRAAGPGGGARHARTADERSATCRSSGAPTTT